MFSKRNRAKTATPADRLQACAAKKLIFDAHCHYFDYRQKTEGVNKLVSAMEAGGVGFAALSGCAFKKSTFILRIERLASHPE